MNHPDCERLGRRQVIFQPQKCIVDLCENSVTNTFICAHCAFNRKMCEYCGKPIVSRRDPKRFAIVED